MSRRALVRRLCVGLCVGLALAAVSFARAGGDPIVLGVVPGKDADALRSLVRGARLALDVKGEKSLVELRVGESGGRWGNAASAAVRLARTDRAVALIAPPDRATAHLVVQVATKARVPVVSTSPAASVTRSGSKWVVTVVSPDASARMPATARRAYRKQHNEAPDDAARAGYAAARAFLTAWRSRGEHDGKLMPALAAATAR